MKAIELIASGAPEQLQLREVAAPQPQAGEVVIEVAWAGVNRPDCLQRQGLYPPPATANPRLGLEVSGRVIALGAGVSSLELGQPVCALCNGGGYAEQVSVPAGQCLPWPAGHDALAAAALPENYFTVWANVFELGQLQRGQSVLVHGAASGIGLTTVQLAQALGAEVCATVSSADKAGRLRQMGVQVVVPYREQSFAEVIAQHYPHGVDVIVDIVGGPYLAANLKLLALDGRLVFIGTLGGSTAELDIRYIMARRARLTGSTLRPRSVAEKTHLAQQLREQVWPLLEQGLARPVIDRVFDLAQASAAHRYLESNQAIGKVMLRVKGE